MMLSTLEFNHLASVGFKGLNVGLDEGFWPTIFAAH